MEGKLTDANLFKWWPLHHSSLHPQHQKWRFKTDLWSLTPVCHINYKWGICPTYSRGKMWDNLSGLFGHVCIFRAIISKRIWVGCWLFGGLLKTYNMTVENVTDTEEWSTAVSRNNSHAWNHGSFWWLQNRNASKLSHAACMCVHVWICVWICVCVCVSFAHGSGFVSYASRSLSIEGYRDLLLQTCDRRTECYQRPSKFWMLWFTI